jgi:hypothetical protein
MPVSRATFEQEAARRREMMRQYPHLKTRFREWNHDTLELPYGTASASGGFTGLYVAGVYRPQGMMHLSSDPVLSVKERAEQRLLTDTKRSSTRRSPSR